VCRRWLLADHNYIAIISLKQGCIPTRRYRYLWYPGTVCAYEWCEHISDCCQYVSRPWKRRPQPRLAKRVSSLSSSSSCNKYGRQRVKSVKSHPIKKCKLQYVSFPHTQALDGIIVDVDQVCNMPAIARAILRALLQKSGPSCSLQPCWPSRKTINRYNTNSSLIYAKLSRNTQLGLQEWPRVSACIYIMNNPKTYTSLQADAHHTASLLIFSGSDDCEKSFRISLKL
jgi:hypothetical protein